MAPWSGRKCLRIINNIRSILAIEILVSGNINYRFHKHLSSGLALKDLMKLLKKSKVLTLHDHPLSNDIEIIDNSIRSGKILNILKKHININ